MLDTVASSCILSRVAASLALAPHAAASAL